MKKGHLPEQMTVGGVTYARSLRYNLNTREEVVVYCKAHGLKYRTVEVLSPRLRGKLDLHNKPYQPHTFFMVEQHDIKVKSSEVIRKGADVSNFGNPVEWQKEQRTDRI